MADDQKKLEILIQTILDKTGSTAAVGEMEKLTVGQRNLATGIPDLNAKTDQYRITTEAEYLAIQKAYDAVTAKIPVLQAAGKSTAEFEKAQANLNAALSTEEAILVAEKMENKAAGAAALEKAAAQDIARHITLESSAANVAAAESAHLNTTAMREITVIARELERGNFSRLPGSISILAGQFGLLSAIMSPVGLALLGTGGAMFLFAEHVKKASEAVRELNAHWQEFDDFVSGADNLKNTDRVIQSLTTSSDDLTEATKRRATATEQLKTDTEELSASEKNELQAQEEIRKKYEEIGLAKIREKLAAGEITPEQAKEQERDLRGLGTRQERSAQNDAEKAEIANLQTELAKEKQIAQGDQLGAGQKTVDVDRAKGAAEFIAGQLEDAKKLLSGEEKYIASGKAGRSGTLERTQEDVKYRQETEMVVQLSQQYQNALAVQKNAEKGASANQSDLDAANARITELEKKLNELTQAHTTNAATRGTLNELDQQQSHIEAITDLLGAKNGKGTQTLGEILNAAKLTEQQKQNLLEKLLNHTLSLNQVYAGLDVRITWIAQQLARVTASSNLH